MLSIFLNVQERSRYIHEVHEHNLALWLVPLRSSPPCRFLAMLDLALEIPSFLLHPGVLSV